MNRLRSPDSPFQRSLAHHQSSSDLARFALKLSEKQQQQQQQQQHHPRDFRGSTEAWVYPSPPMSRSPPLPPKTALEIVGGQAPRSLPIDQFENDQHLAATRQQHPGRHENSSLPPGIPKPYPPNHPVVASSYYLDRNCESGSTLAPYTSHRTSGPSTPRPYSPDSLPKATSSYAVMNQQPLPREGGSDSSPKSQRKTKGHVASACVPCKKAHLRCDAQRPCSRCLSNGKEEACVDVQHKKRGRPRLRDEPETRYDTSRLSHSQDMASRRQLGAYPSVAHLGSLESDGSSSYQTHFRVSEGHGFPPSLTASNRHPEAVAYLSMDMDIVNASPTFLEALAAHELKARRLPSILSHLDQDKIRSIRGLFMEEQMHREPNYLPPILGRGDHIIQQLGFSGLAMDRLLVERKEVLTFLAGDGQPKVYNVRIGLAREDSFYFIVLILVAPLHHRYPSPMSQYRETSNAYPSSSSSTSTQQQHMSAFPRHAPSSSGAFDPARPHVGEGFVQSQSSSRSCHFGVSSRPSPGLSSSNSAYSPELARSDYMSMGSNQTSRSELPLAARAPLESASPHQLPPMRSQPDHAAPAGQRWKRDERYGIMGIEGLIEKPEGQGKPY